MHHSPTQVGAPLSRLWVLHKARAKESDSLQTCLCSPHHGFMLLGEAAQTGFFQPLFLLWSWYHLRGCSGHRRSHCSREERRGELVVGVFKSLPCLWPGEGLWRTRCYCPPCSSSCCNGEGLPCIFPIFCHSPGVPYGL